MEVNVDVSYDGDCNLSDLINKSEPGSNGSRKKRYLGISVFDKFIFLFSNKTKT